MIRLEQRAYSRREISEITGIPQNYKDGRVNRNFIGRVRERLENWHYEVETPRGSAVIITRQPETALDRLHEIMMRKLGFDIQVRPLEFACFMHFMMTVPDADCMPIEERLDFINQNYKMVCLSKSTLERWIESLSDCHALIIDNHAAVRWKSEKINGRVSRTKVDGDPELLEERRRYTERMHELFRERSKTGLTGKALSGSVFQTLWQEFGFGYGRPSPTLVWNGITMSPELYQEILSLVTEICEGKDE